MVNQQQHLEVFSALCWCAMMWLLWVWLWLSHVQPCCFNTRSPTEGLPLSCWDCWRMVTSLLFSGVVSFTSSLYRLPTAMCMHHTKTNCMLIETPLGRTASEVSVTMWQHLSDRLKSDIPRSCHYQSWTGCHGSSHDSALVLFTNSSWRSPVPPPAKSNPSKCSHLQAPNLL